jgi:hypothetical protein
MASTNLGGADLEGHQQMPDHVLHGPFTTEALGRPLLAGQPGEQISQAPTLVGDLREGVHALIFPCVPVGLGIS